MATRRRVLRSFLYLNEDIVDDYLSQLEGGIIEGPYTTKDTTSKGKEGGVGLNKAPKVGVFDEGSIRTLWAGRCNKSNWP